MRILGRFLAFAFVLALFLPYVAYGQSPTATLTGRVTDPSKAVIPGTSVIAINTDTGIHYEAVTDGSGSYVIVNLPPAKYRIEVQKPGFKTVVKPDVILHLQDTVEINFDMALGSASEIVTVQAGAPLVNTESASVSTVIDREFVENLPLNGRSFNALLQLTPGVVLAQSMGGPEQPGQYSISGQRQSSNNFTIDGVSANFGVGSTTTPGESGFGSAQAFSAIGGTSSLISVDDLQEFRVETSSFAPEFGRAPGGQVILTTRAGTNQFHGEAFDYFRNDVMDANDWFANEINGPHAPERHNDFGGVFGGPIIKDKTFFFFSYEGARLRLPQTTPIQVPSNDARAAAVAPAQPIVDAFPVPNGPVTAGNPFTALFTGVFSNKATLDATSLRIDHTFNSRFSIFGRYNYAPSQTANRVFSLNTIETTPVNTQTLTAGVNMSLTSKLLNNVRFNYSSQTSQAKFTMDSFGGAVPPDLSVFFGSASSADSNVEYNAFDTTLFLLGPFAKNQSKQLNFADDVNLTVGSHQLKMGADYRAIFLNSTPPMHGLGFESFALSDLVTSGQLDAIATSTQIPTQFLAQSLSLYGQDTWKITPRLTAIYGLRWELSPAPSTRGKTQASAWLHTDDPSQLVLAPFGTSLWNTQYGNFAPRFGVAYSLTQRGDFVVRAGAGIFYDLAVGSAANLSGTLPNDFFQETQNFPLPVTDIAPFYPSTSVSPPYAALTLNGFAHNLKLPSSYQWNVALEKSFGGHQAITATYVGQAGRDLLREQALTPSNANFNPNTRFFLTLNEASSDYNALEIQYRKPFSSGFQVILNYTWSHSLDDASNDVIAGLANTVISAASDRGNSDFDVRNSFSGALVYNIPGVSKSPVLSALTKGWSVDTIVVVRSGFPFNGIEFLSSPDTTGAVSTRPDLVPGQPFYVSGPQCVNPITGASGFVCPGGKSLNPAAFVDPPTVRQGNEPRNDIPGFGLTQVDLSLGRKFALTERLNLQFRADAFNVLNHPNFSNPQGFTETQLFGTFGLQSQAMLNEALGGLNPLFQEGGPRSLQLSLKLTF